MLARGHHQEHKRVCSCGILVERRWYIHRDRFEELEEILISSKATRARLAYSKDTHLRLIRLALESHRCNPDI